MKITTLINNKIKDIKLNNSQGTYRFYLSHTSHFLKWCENNNVILTSDFTDNKLIDYINFNKKSTTAATLNKRIGILKRTYIFNSIEFEYLFNIKKFKEVKKTFNIVTPVQIKLILSYVNNLDKNKLMQKLLIHLLIDTGARINELMNIKKVDLKLTDKEIVLTTTKTKVERIVYFLEDTKSIIKEVLDQQISTPYLFYNLQKERPINYEDVRYFFRIIKRDLEIDKLHPHMFRHAFATTLIENDADLVSVMQILGHSNIETTERYLHLSNKHVKKTYQNKFKR